MSRQGDFFFGIEDVYRQLNKVKDPLLLLKSEIPWETFRGEIAKVRRKIDRKSNAGRKPYDDVLMFKVMVLQALYNLSDEQTEFQIRDRLSFRRFLGLDINDEIPDAKTIWLFREQLRIDGVTEKLFKKFDGYLNRKGFIARGGQIIDASFVEVPIQRNDRDENGQIKEGETPEEWEDEPAKLAQKDVEARWAQKNGENFYGYKNHLSVDNRHKLIRCYEVTAANVHDSQILVNVIDPNNTNADVYADSAYRSEATEEELKTKGYRSKIHFKAKRNKPLTERQEKANRLRTKIRVRVEHVFGYQVNSMKANFIRTIGMERAEVKIGLNNIVYNMQRFLQLARLRGGTAS